MDINEVNDAVLKIIKSQGDYEIAHGMEDDLHAKFIKHVAESDCGDLSIMAKAILKTADIDFARHCA